MAYEQRDMTGSLFKNDKQGVDTRPDYNGSILIDGKKIWISGWVNRPEGKEPFFSLKLKYADQQQKSSGTTDDLGDGIPF
jgi:hypothetical protein